MQRLPLKAQVREGLGKGAARGLRRTGLIPAVLYGRGRSPQAISVDAKAFSAVVHTHAGMNVLIDLELTGNGSGDSTVVMVKEVQRDIFKHHPIHIDFHAISLTETLEAHVPIVLNGTPKGVVEGGVVEHHLREVVVECLPTQIPERIDLDISDLVVGRSLHASDLVIPEGIRLVTPPEEVVVTVVAPRVHEEEVPAAAPVEGEVAVPAEGVPAPAAEAPQEAGKKEKAAEAE